MAFRWVFLFPALAATACFSQTANPAFEVASVKALGDSFPSGFSMAPRRSGDRITWNTNRNGLLRYAYNLPEWRVQGLEPKDAFYAIEAATPASTTDAQVRVMVESLLRERFKLAVHREMRERNGYSLVAGKSGARIRPAGPGDKTAPLPPWFQGKSPEFATALEGRIVQSMEGRGQIALTGRGVTMSQLAGALEEPLGTFVVDKTGLAGKYYFGILFAKDEVQMNGDLANTELPSLFAAVAEQLGLKLDKQKGITEILVVDHMEKIPTAN